MDKEQELNNKIDTLNRKIKNIRVRDDIIGIVSGFTLITGINYLGYTNIPNIYESLFGAQYFIMSIGIGIIPSICLPTYKTMKKVAKYKIEITKCLQEKENCEMKDIKQKVKTK